MKKMFLLALLPVFCYGQVRTITSNRLFITKNQCLDVLTDKVFSVKIQIDERNNPGIIRIECNNCPLQENLIIKSKTSMNQNGEYYYDYLVDKIYRHIAVNQDAVYFYYYGTKDFIELSDFD